MSPHPLAGHVFTSRYQARAVLTDDGELDELRRRLVTAAAWIADVLAALGENTGEPP